MNFLLAVVCLFAVISVSIAQPTKHDEPKLIVISLDALMFKQINETTHMPYLLNFAKSGVHCPTVKPVFPTKTFTNHFSIATGLYAGSHGVTGNRVYDNVNKKKLSFTSRELFTSRENITPIWTLNQLAGKKSAVSMWIAGQFEFRGETPEYVSTWVENFPWKPRIDAIIPLLTRKKDPINFVMFYADQPDGEEHVFSPNSNQATKSLKDMDEMVKYWMDELKKANLTHNTDIIIVSDHGMETVTKNPEYIIDLSKYANNTWFTLYGDSVVAQVISNGRISSEDICHLLKAGAKENKHFSAYTNDDDELQKRWHVRNERFFGPCVVVAHPGYVFQNIEGYFEIQDKRREKRSELEPELGYGYHGYDNESPSMQGIFLAKGPRFKENVAIKKMELVDHFHLFAHLLGIKDTVWYRDLKPDHVVDTKIFNQMLKCKIN